MPNNNSSNNNNNNNNKSSNKKNYNRTYNRRSRNNKADLDTSQSITSDSRHHHPDNENQDSDAGWDTTAGSGCALDKAWLMSSEWDGEWNQGGGGGPIRVVDQKKVWKVQRDYRQWQYNKYQENKSMQKHQQNQVVQEKWWNTELKVKVADFSMYKEEARQEQQLVEQMEQIECQDQQVYVSLDQTQNQDRQQERRQSQVRGRAQTQAQVQAYEKLQPNVQGKHIKNHQNYTQRQNINKIKVSERQSQAQSGQQAQPEQKSQQSQLNYRQKNKNQQHWKQNKNQLQQNQQQYQRQPQQLQHRDSLHRESPQTSLEFLFGIAAATTSNPVSNAPHVDKNYSVVSVPPVDSSKVLDFHCLENQEDNLLLMELLDINCNSTNVSKEFAPTPHDYPTKNGEDRLKCNRSNKKYNNSCNYDNSKKSGDAPNKQHFNDQNYQHRSRFQKNQYAKKKKIIILPDFHDVQIPSEDDELDYYRCDICNKYFLNEKQVKSHYKQKTHMDNEERFFEQFLSSHERDVNSLEELQNGLPFGIDVEGAVWLRYKRQQEEARAVAVAAAVAAAASSTT